MKRMASCLPMAMSFAVALAVFSACAAVSTPEEIVPAPGIEGKADSSAAVPASIRDPQLLTSKDRLMAYYDPVKGQWRGGEWWQQPILLETMIHLAARLPDSGTDVAALSREVFEKNRKASFINNYFDDSAWWALCWLTAYEWTREPRYLEAAEVIFRHLATKGWDASSCGGGVVWHVTKRYKNAISTGLFLCTALALYRLSVQDGRPDPSYLGWAEKSWAWIQGSGLINDDGLINDGLDAGCRNNGQNPWTYNQGVIVGALSDFYRIKGDPAYLDRAYRLAEANLGFNSADGILLEKGCGEGTCGDGAIFKGVFIRNLAALLRASPADRPERARFEAFLTRNANAAWGNRLESGLFGLRWDKVVPGGNLVGTQCSGIDLLLAAPLGSAAEQPTAPEFCLYESADFGGASVCHPVPTEIWMLPEPFQDRVSSIRVFPGACLTVYWDFGYQGESREIRGHTSWIGDHWNDQITSLRAHRCDP